MHRDADGTRLIGDRAGNGLPDPPGCICREFVSLCIVELVDGADEAGIALLNKIQNVQAAAGIFLGDGYDQTQVSLRQTVFGGLIALGDALGQLDLLVGSQQLDLADLLEIHAHRIIQIVFRGKLQRVNELLVVAVGDLVHVHAEIVGHVQLQLRAHDLDAHGVKGIVNMLDFLDRQIQLFQLCGQFRRLNAPVPLCSCDQCGYRSHCILGRGLRILRISHSIAHPHLSGNIAAHRRNCVIITPSCLF